MNIDWPDLPGLFPGFDGAARWLPLLERHAQLIEEAAPKVRVSADEGPAVIGRHYGESLELLRIVREVSAATMVIDVGSGGGFPGLVIAAVEPRTTVHVVEPLRKRAALMEAMAAALDLANVTVHAERAEEAGRGPLRDSSPLVFARAVAHLRELIEYTAPLAGDGGLLVLPKGSGVDVEIDGAANAMRVLGCEVAGRFPMRPEISATLTVVVLRKRGSTPGRYPRRPGMPAKRPL